MRVYDQLPDSALRPGQPALGTGIRHTLRISTSVVLRLPLRLPSEEHDQQHHDGNDAGAGDQRLLAAGDLALEVTLQRGEALLEIVAGDPLP